MNRLYRNGPDTFIGALLRAPLRLVPKGTVVTVRAGLNNGMRWIVGSSTHGCWLGHYEIDKQQEVRRLVIPGMKVFDVGANAGFYTLAFARLVGEAGQVWAFEPLAENVHSLRKHVALNRLANVTVVQAAVSDVSGMSGFALADDNSMGHLTEEGDYLVPTIALDEFCAGPCGGYPDFIKLDVEGAEGAVLKGAKETLSKGRPIVMLALHGRDQERECLQLLLGHGYRLFYLDGKAVDRDSLSSDEVVAMPGER